MILQRLAAAQGLFRYQSGRVIALGRVMLAILFLLAVWLDRSEPTRAVAGTYALLCLYVVAAIGIAAATWRNWWLDARLAVSMHAFDMAVFTGIVFSTNGSTSPFFLFFVLPLLSAAIRWGWRETALTATALILLYLTAGALLARTQAFELERFVVRSGHLLILSLLLIWFGIHQRGARLFFSADGPERDQPAGKDAPAVALEFAIRATKAAGGALLVAPHGDAPTKGFRARKAEAHTFRVDHALVRSEAYPAFLYDLANDRAVSRLPKGAFEFVTASELLDAATARRLSAEQGLVAEVRTGTRHGWLILWGVPDMSTDFIDFGRELGRAAGAIIDRQELFEAIEIGTAARTRLSIARDVHDSIVQFLAGAAFRLEAIKRSPKINRSVANDLDELKRLLVEEQGEIRAFLLALRSDRALGLAEAVAELRALAGRLSRQWSIDCTVTAEGDDGSIPIRLQLDLQQMLREAVANAVRHGKADRVEVGLAVEGNRLQLRVADNGSGFTTTTEPWSLKERVERAHGSLRLMSEAGSTNILISLPVAGAAA